MLDTFRYSHGMAKASLTIRLDKKLLEAAKRKAIREDVTFSQIVRKALRKYVGR